MTAPLLTTGMLDELHAAWREQGALIADGLRPGLTDTEMTALARSSQLALPVEARVWWGWHDGTNSMTGSYAVGRELLFLPLARALDLYRQQLTIAENVAEGEESLTPDDVWPRAWLPLSTEGNGAMMVCDCSVAEGAPTPIRHFNHEFAGESRRVVAESLGQVVSWWLAALDSRAWTWDRNRGVWEEHHDRLPDPQIARTNLV